MSGSGRRSEAIPAQSADGLKVRLRAGNEFHPMERGLKVRANHGRTQAPVICADLRPAMAQKAVYTRQDLNPRRIDAPVAKRMLDFSGGSGIE
jgi:hypothetical protein